MCVFWRYSDLYYILWKLDLQEELKLFRKRFEQGNDSDLIGGFVNGLRNLDCLTAEDKAKYKDWTAYPVAGIKVKVILDEELKPIRYRRLQYVQEIIKILMEKHASSGAAVPQSSVSEKCMDF